MAGSDGGVGRDVVVEVRLRNGAAGSEAVRRHDRRGSAERRGRVERRRGRRLGLGRGQPVGERPRLLPRHVVAESGRIQTADPGELRSIITRTRCEPKAINHRPVTHAYLTVVR